MWLPTFCITILLLVSAASSLIWYRDGAGKSYNDIKLMCKRRGSRLCYYKEACPYGGAFKPPFGGPQHKGDMWSPIQMAGDDHIQNWIQVGTRAGGMCNLLTNYHSATIPNSWMTTRKNAGYKKIYPCCANQKTIAKTLIWYNDGIAKGYNDFTATCKTRGQRLCYFNEVCPSGGPGKPPFGGRPATGDKWSPIQMSINDPVPNWVQVGTRAGGMCNLLTTYHLADLPGSWMVRRSRTTIKTHYPCCALKTVIGTHLRWYKDGTSKSYADMKSMCISRGKRLCYFKEVCPYGGPYKPPLSGPQANKDMWSPIQMSAADSKPNWIQSGTRAGGMCNLLTKFHPADNRNSWMVTQVNRSYKKVFPCCW